MSFSDQLWRRVNGDLILSNHVGLCVCRNVDNSDEKISVVCKGFFDYTTQEC